MPVILKKSQLTGPAMRQLGYWCTTEHRLSL